MGKSDKSVMIKSGSDNYCIFVGKLTHRIMKRSLFIITLALGIFTSCEKESDKPDNRVAVFVPTSESSLRWALDKQYLEEALGKYDLDVTLQLANNNTGANDQLNQIKSALDKGIRNLVVVPIDYKVLNDANVFGNVKGLNLVAHDRMLYDCNEVDYYSDCDSYEIGSLQGQYIIQTLLLSGKQSMTIELFGGPTSDNNAALYFKGAYDQLKPYIDNGMLVAVSGKTDYKDVCISSWKVQDAKTAVLERLNGYYSLTTMPDIILSPSDNVAIGSVQALEQYYTSVSKYPVITGMDNTANAVQMIKDGKISMTIDKSIRDMAYNTALLITSLMNGYNPVTPKSFDNGVKQVPEICSAPVVYTIANL